MRSSRVVAVILGVASVGVLFGGCAEPDPEAIYLAGDYLEARKHYNGAKCATVPAEQAVHCQARAAEIERALEGAAKYLGERANDLTIHRKDIQFNRYEEAIRCLRLALEIMDESHPSREEYVDALKRLEDTRAALTKEYEEQLVRIDELLAEGTYDPKVWTDVRLAFERVRILRFALALSDPRPWELGQRLMEKFRRHGQYEHANLAAELSLAVEDRGETDRSERQITDRDLVLFGVLAMRSEEQRGVREEKIGELEERVDTLRKRGDMEEATKVAREALALAPSARLTRKLENLISKVEGAERQEAARVAREVTRVEPEPAGVEPVALMGRARPEPPAPPPLQPAPPKKPEEAEGLGPRTKENMVVRLGELAALYKKGRKYDAMAGLERLVVHYKGSPHQARAIKLRDVWSAERKVIIEDLIQEANQLFVQMDERSRDLYVRAGKLHPEGTMAQHVRDRIATLDRLMAE